MYLILRWTPNERQPEPLDELEEVKDDNAPTEEDPPGPKGVQWWE